MKRQQAETRKTKGGGESPLFFFTLFLGIPAKGKEQSSVGVVYCSVIAVVNDFFLFKFWHGLRPEPVGARLH